MRNVRSEFIRGSSPPDEAVVSGAEPPASALLKVAWREALRRWRRLRGGCGRGLRRLNWHRFANNVRVLVAVNLVDGGIADIAVTVHGFQNQLIRLQLNLRQTDEVNCACVANFQLLNDHQRPQQPRQYQQHNKTATAIVDVKTTTLTLTTTNNNNNNNSYNIHKKWQQNKKTSTTTTMATTTATKQR
jgi:hypothetical protein